MAFIYDLTDTWNNAGISFNGIKLNATDTASAAGSKLLDLQINGASKLAVGKTGTVTATGLIESTVGGFRFPDGTTQTTKATVNSVSGTGTVNGITLTGTITNTGSLTLGGTLGNIANNQLTNSAITINGTSTPLGGSIAVGTVTSVGGTGTVSGLSLTGSITTSGSLTLGGTLVLTSGQVTDGLGYTPYNATNPAGYTTNVGTVTSVAGTGTVNGLTLTGSVTTSGSLTLGGTLGNIANSQLTNSAITINGTSTALGGSISVGTVTSVAALTLGTSGTDLASSVANGTTTPVITLNVPTASAVNRGALSSSDWSTFNAKQAALVSGTNIKTVGGASLLGSGDVGTIGLAYGGTGATTDSGARTSLGLGTAAVLNAGVAGGVATLDGSGTVPTSQLPGAVLGGLNYQGTWNASTNVPTLASSVGSKGYYYVVSTAGSTNLNGITDWKIGDWAVYDGSTWQKVDNTDAVSSVNGFTGAVVLTTTDVAQGTNLYFTQAAARGSVSAGTGISYNSTSGVITNSAPDQTVALTGAGTTVVTGTYPNFTITSNDSIVGTVTSVAASGGTTGLSFTGSPITTAGTLTLGGTLALANGGTGATTASGARTALELGTAATTDASAYATAAQGAKADTAVQTIASADGSVTITGTTAIDLSVAVAGSTSNVLLPVRNTTGATLTKGTAVYISGATGQLSTVSKAIASSDPTSAQTLGLVTANISNNANGNVTLIGTITNIDTSAYTDGQQLYLSPTTAGTLTATKPHAPQHLVYMAIVEHAHPSQGKLFVKVQNGYEMDELHDVSAQSPANNDGLFYSTSTDLWEKKSIATALGYTPYNATNPAGYTTNTGTVTSVGGTGTVSGLTLTGTVTTSGNLTLGGTLAVTPSNFASQTANTVLAAPNGAAGVPTFRAIVAADIPTLNQNTTGTALNVTGTVAVGNGGTGATTLTSGYLVKGNGTSAVSASVVYDTGTNVGIGTSSPGVKLDVQGATPFIRVKENTTGYLGLRAENTSGNFYFGIDSSTGSFFGSAYARAVYADGAYPMVFYTNAAERMRITSAGDVGVGTNAPSQKLNVVGNTLIPLTNSYFCYTNDYGIGTPDSLGLQVFASNGDVLRFGHRTGGTTFTEDMRIASNGNVGIGTNAPAHKLHVQSSIDPVIAVQGTTAGYPTGFMQSGNGAVYVGAAGAYPYTFYTNGAERMRITAGGNVGIGVSNPGVSLDIAKADGSLYLRDGTTGNASIFMIAAGTSYAEIQSARFGVDYNMPLVLNRQGGNVGIGTSSPAAKLDVVHNQAAFSYFDYTNSTNGGGVVWRQIVRNIANTGTTSVDLAKIGGGFLINNNDTNAANFTAFGVGASERMRITSAGRLGIGVTSPAEALDVKSQINVTNSSNISMNAVRASNFGYSSGYSALVIGSTSGNNTPCINVDPVANASGAFNGSGIEVMFRNGVSFITPNAANTSYNREIFSMLDGNVGIGNSAAAAKLHVSGIARISDSTNSTAVNIDASTTGGLTSIITQFGGSQLALGSAGSERMRIDSSGNLLWNKSSVGSETTTDGVTFYKNASGGGTVTYLTNGGTGTVLAVSTQGDTGAVIFYRSGTQVGSISVTSSSTAYNTSSDYRLKDIDGPIANSGAYIDALKPVQGSWKADGSRFIGLLAHEVQEVSETPIATGDKDGEEMQAMDYSAPELIANLIAEIQSLRARVAQLEGN